MAPSCRMPTPLRYLTLRILKMKMRNPGTCITCQEVFNILIYGLIMGFALIGLKMTPKRSSHIMQTGTCKGGVRVSAGTACL